MAKFLDYDGLVKVWAKIKDLLKTTVTDKIGQAEGIASLDTEGKLTDSQLPDNVATLTDGRISDTMLPVLKTINGTSIVGAGDIEIKFDLIKVVDTLPTKPEEGDENKIFLVTDTASTEDKNVYVEYLWTGTEWEIAGKFKADVDLTNYVQKTDLATETKDGLMSKEDKEKLDSIETMTLAELDEICK